MTSIGKRLNIDTEAVGRALLVLYRKGAICKSGMNKNAHKWFAVEHGQRLKAEPREGDNA